MQYRTRSDLTYHDRTVPEGQPTAFIVPAGELVEIVALNSIPEDQGRREIRQGIEGKKRSPLYRTHEFVPIKIRNWFALIDKTKLEPVTSGPSATLSDKSRRRPLEVAGLRSAASATCSSR